MPQKCPREIIAEHLPYVLEDKEEERIERKLVEKQEEVWWLFYHRKIKEKDL